MVGGGVAYLNPGSSWISFNSQYNNNRATRTGGGFFLEQAKLYLGNLPPQMDSITLARSMRTAPLGGAGCTKDTCNFPAPSLTSAYPAS